MKVKFILACILPGMLPLTALSAPTGPGFSTHVALTSNYVFRGLTLSDDNLAIQGGIEWKESEDAGWYAGSSASTVDSGSASGMEIDLYGGYKGGFSANSVLGYELGAIIYEYTNSQFSEGETELLLGVNYESAYLKLFLGDNKNPGAGSYTYLDLGATFLVMNELDLDVHFGHFSSSWASDANDLSASLSKEIAGVKLSLTASYIDESATGSETEFLVTVKKQFD